MPFDESFDLVIVGSGAASVPAALTARSLGQSAVILEKQDKFGGSTAYSGGVAWIPNSPLHGATDSEEAGRQYLNALLDERADKASPPAKREMFLKEGPKAIRFLMDQGIKFILVLWPDYYPDKPGGHATGRSLMCELLDLNELGEWKDKLGYFYGFPRMPVNSWEFVFLTLAKRTWRGKLSALGLGWRMFKDKLTGKTAREGQARPAAAGGAQGRDPDQAVDPGGRSRRRQGASDGRGGRWSRRAQDYRGAARRAAQHGRLLAQSRDAAEIPARARLGRLDPV